MLHVKGFEVSRRPDYKGATPFVLDLVDNDTPQKRAMSLRIPVSWDGLFAIKEVIDKLIGRDSSIAESLEKKGTHPVPKLKEKV